MRAPDTADESSGPTGTSTGSTPGLLVVFDGGPVFRPIPLPRGELVLGRDGPGQYLTSEHISREHVAIRREGARWEVRDLGSRNGTFVDLKQVSGTLSTESPRVMRVGQSVLVFAHDLRALDSIGVTLDGGMVAGPLFRRALERTRAVAAEGSNLFIFGESGSGKELVARAFHAASRHPKGPMVAVNCAAIPPGVAERLLFGARKGAYSGADTDVTGYFQAAKGGVLFLDEVGELEAEVQAKLLRAIETKEVLPLGASAPVRVDVQLCFATHRSLRDAVTAGHFRQDLFFRIAQPEVALPPLRERPEEIPFILDREATATEAGMTLHGKLVEACVSRYWPGNVRELLTEARSAAQAARTAGSKVVRVEHLAPRAGVAFDPEQAEKSSPADLTREQVERALAQEAGNVAAAARVLGLHRTQLYRLLKRFQIQASTQE